VSASKVEPVSGERLALLREHVDSRVSQAKVYEVVGGIETALAAFGIGLGIHDWNDDRRSSLVMVTGFGAQILALSTALAVSRDAADAVLEESLV
jgi:hypothetical protein